MTRILARRVGCSPLLAVALLALTACGTLAKSGASSDPSLPLPPRCAATGPQSIAHNRWVAPRHKLAPAGASAIRLCRYDGLNAKPQLQLLASVLIHRRAAVASLVRQFDSLRQPKGAISCPLDDGSQIVALVAYPEHHHVTISVRTAGCAIVTNGDVGGTAVDFGGENPVGPRLLARLEQLTGQGASG